MIIQEISRKAIGALVLIALFQGSVAIAQVDYRRPYQRAADEYLALLMKGSPDDLERAADDARKASATIPDGQPKLAAFYGGVAGCVFQLCAHRLTDEDWKARRQKIEEWRNRRSDSVTAEVSMAMNTLQYGWYVRGTGGAHNISEERWKLFNERVETARQELEKLGAVAKRDPGWFDAMLLVALSQGWPRERFDALYETAARQHPSYIPIHFIGVAYHSERWHGSQQQMQEFIERATAHSRAQLGEMVYARLHWAMANARMFQGGQADWPRMKRGFERLIKDYPDPWNLNNYARFACLANDWPTVSQQLAAIGDNVIINAWFRRLEFYTHCQTRANEASKSALTN